MERASSDIDNQLLNVVRGFLSEVKTDRALNAVALDASIERDLGIDSLGRVELFLRIERTFSIALPDSLMAEAEFLTDIARAVKTASPTAEKVHHEFATVLEVTHFDPSSATTLVDVLLRHAESTPDRPHIYLQNERGEEHIIRYGQLLSAALKTASGLCELGLKRNETVAIMLPTSEAFFYAFLGVLLAGGIPVPIYPPIRPDKIEEYAVREAAILNNAEVRVLITFSKVETLGKLLRVFIKSLKAVTTVEMLMQSTGSIPRYSFKEEDSALIQYTSGSTSAPKGVLLSHQNLLANIRSVGKAVGVGPRDVGVSWLPLYHDMGLIGAWFAALYHGFPLTVMSPLSFLSRPERWLWAIHYHRGTLSAGPNFAYELCIRKIREEDIQGLDLSSWRLAFNGAEAINPRTLERFTQKFAPFGFRPETFYPVYGLAESSVGLTFPVPGNKPKVDVIAREPFETEQCAIPVDPSTVPSTQYLEFVGCGKPLPDHDIRIVDENGQEVDERKVGSLHFCGPSSMRGYYHNVEATQAIYYDGWWDSGDFAYLVDGEVYITGRKKDIIIKAGRNLYPQEIEEVAAQVHGVRKGCVVAFGVQDPKWGTESLLVVAETQETKKPVRQQIVNEIIEKISVVVGIPPDQVVLVSPKTIPKTSSGKLQRSATKKAYLEGKLAKKGLPVWAQMVKLFFKGLGVTGVRFLSKIARYFYTAYAILVLGIFLIPAWLSVLLFSQSLARRSVKFFSYLFVRSLGPFSVEGLEHFQSKTAMIYVCNHASYLDSIYLLAILPCNVLFVAKKEVETWPIVGRTVRKLGFLMIDRMDFSKNISDTHKIAETLKNRQAVLIYPEGTFTYATGLRPFKLGAFKVSVDTGKPLCPIAIQGTRVLMRGDHWLLKPTSIKVKIGKSLIPVSQEWSEVTRLHTLARTVIAKECGELEIDLVAASVGGKKH